MDMNLSKLWEIVKDREIWHAAGHGVSVRYNLVTEHQQQKSITCKYISKINAFQK